MTTVERSLTLAGSQTDPVRICELDELRCGVGVTALIGGRPIAIFRLADDEVIAIDAVDPRTGAAVLARGIVGSDGARRWVASPLYKQRYDLDTGDGLDDGTRVSTWTVQLREGAVWWAGG
jgi:nitrite reductase (NADH) small subunit